MPTYYWTIDLYNSKTNELIKKGEVKYATEFQAEMVARDMVEIPQDIIIKIAKNQFDF